MEPATAMLFIIGLIGMYCIYKQAEKEAVDEHGMPLRLQKTPMVQVSMDYSDADHQTHHYIGPACHAPWLSAIRWHIVRGNDKCAR